MGLRNIQAPIPDSMIVFKQQVHKTVVLRKSTIDQIDQNDFVRD